jgi:hypothetical protein
MKKIIGGVRRTKTTMRMYPNNNCELVASGEGTWYGIARQKNDLPAGVTLYVASTWTMHDKCSPHDGKPRNRKGYKVLGPEGQVYFMTRSTLSKWCEVIE